MKHLELHILQSFPVTCLNRDDQNSPKTAIFGGVQRARVSSQSWKRAIRELSIKICPMFNKGERTRLIIDPMRDALINEDVAETEATDKAKAIADELLKLDEKAEKESGILKVKTLFFTTQAELKEIAKAYIETGDVKKAVKKLSAALLKDAADISLFGRMVASHHSLTVEGAAMFSHALSTHAVQNELEYFSALDDLQPKDESGAGMNGTIEFNSATYYRFCAINLDLLRDADHLLALTQSERRQIMRAFIEATLLAVPMARRNSMNGNTLPGYVLGIVRDKGHPIQLINAFENPIRSSKDKGFYQNSIDALKEEYSKTNKIWGLKDRELVSAAIPDVTLFDFLDQMVSHVE